MAVLFSGGCACGSIRYECSAAPQFAEICYCRDCQRASGSAFAAIFGVPVANFVLKSGAPKYYGVTGESGARLERGFCPECGAPVFLKAQRAPDLMFMVGGSLDDPSRFPPQVEVWTGSAPPWAWLHPQLPKIEGIVTNEQLAELRTQR